MTKEEWRKIRAAKEFLQLEDMASLDEIKRAFRQLAKKWHPDMAPGAGQAPDTPAGKMPELLQAYHTLLAYCAAYRYPLVPSENEPIDPEDWWLDRFGTDHVGARGRPKENG